jgi:Uncharacterized protein conserved in bacteria (DUF2325)
VALPVLPPVSQAVVKVDWRPGILLGRPMAEARTDVARRSRLWELAETLHCSIIGTCLTTAELRRTLVRIGVSGAETADEHELHVSGVTLAGRRDAGAKLLQKALDRRHETSIKRYASARDAEMLGGLWDEAVKSGDIPGAYWAVLTHPAATEELVKKTFRAVHMLSHLVGAANRADIRRLREQEQQIEMLTGTVERLQQRLRDGFASREATIRQLQDMLVRRVGEQAVGSAGMMPEVDRDGELLQEVIADLNRKLGAETTRRKSVEQRLEAADAAARTSEAKLRRTTEERDALARDLAAIDFRVAGLLAGANEADLVRCDLLGRTVLYVGGRASQIPQLKAMVERSGAAFLHHDGGIEQSAGLLPGLVSRADLVFFPVDCISHDAAATVKRSCRMQGKPYAPLRTASLTALMAALAAHEGGAAVAAE